MTLPGGDRVDKWATVPTRRDVLLVAHNSTTLNRIVDLIGVFESDPRVQLSITSNFRDPFTQDLPGRLAEFEVTFIAWERARERSFELIISASHHGDIHQLKGKIVILSHGIGYTKYAPEEPGTRNPEPGTRNPEPGTRNVFGLSRPWLVNGSDLIAAALVFSHPEQLERLARDVPEAVGTAYVGGDPCFDRMLESRRFRRRFRAALGIGDDRKLVVVSSTWSGSSALGAAPDLLRRLLAALPVDEFQVALIAHPNIGNRHGPAQLRLWFADAVRAGLILLDPHRGWQAALIAADCVIGDHGSVTAYGAALDRPTLLADFPQDDIVAGTAVAAVARLAPRLRPHDSLRRQVREAIDGHVPGRFAEVRSLVSSVPGQSPELLRRLFYRLLDLPEPPGEPVLIPFGTAGLTARSGPRAAAMLVLAEWVPGLRLERFAYDTRPFAEDVPGAESAHMVVHHEHPVRGVRHTADVVFGLEHDIDDAPGWLAETLADHPACLLAAAVLGRTCLIRARDGDRLHLTHDGGPGVDASVLASVAYTWKAGGHPLGDLPDPFPVWLAGREILVRRQPPVKPFTRPG